MTNCVPWKRELSEYDADMFCGICCGSGPRIQVLTQVNPVGQLTNSGNALWKEGYCLIFHSTKWVRVCVKGKTTRNANVLSDLHRKSHSFGGRHQKSHMWQNNFFPNFSLSQASTPQGGHKSKSVSFWIEESKGKRHADKLFKPPNETEPLLKTYQMVIDLQASIWELFFCIWTALIDHFIRGPVCEYIPALLFDLDLIRMENKSSESSSHPKLELEFADYELGITAGSVHATMQHGKTPTICQSMHQSRFGKKGPCPNQMLTPVAESKEPDFLWLTVVLAKIYFCEHWPVVLRIFSFLSSTKVEGPTCRSKGWPSQVVLYPKQESIRNDHHWESKSPVLLTSCRCCCEAMRQTHQKKYTRTHLPDQPMNGVRWITWK